MGQTANLFVDKLKHLSDCENYLFYFIDSNINECKRWSLTQLATAAGVSTTTVIRLTKKLGLSGFSELKFKLREATENQFTASETRQQFRSALAAIALDQDAEKYRALAKTVCASRAIHIFALGLSVGLGEYLVHQFSQLGIISVLSHYPHLVDLAVTDCRAEDSVIMISAGGKTASLVVAAERLTARNIGYAAFTCNPQSVVARQSKYSFSTDITPINTRGHDSTPRSLLMNMLDYLYLAVTDIRCN